MLILSLLIRLAHAEPPAPVDAPPADVPAQAQLAHAAYLNEIRRSISTHWQANLDQMPAAVHLKGTEFTTRVLVTLDRAGTVLSTKLVASSGQSSLDAAVTQAIEQLGKVEPPPGDFLDDEGRAELPVFEFTVHMGDSGKDRFLRRSAP